MKSKVIYFVLILSAMVQSYYSQNYELKSPNKKLVVKIVNNQGLKYSLSFNNQNLIEEAEISINIDEKVYPLLNSTVVNFKIL